MRREVPPGRHGPKSAAGKLALERLRVGFGGPLVTTAVLSQVPFHLVTFLSEFPKRGRSSAFLSRADLNGKQNGALSPNKPNAMEKKPEELRIAQAKMPSDPNGVMDQDAAQTRQS